jgi:hypothetical protein
MSDSLEEYNEIVKNRFKNMSPEKKLNLSLNLYYSAFPIGMDSHKLKVAAMKHFYPNLNDEEIEKKVKAIFFYART